MLIRKHISFVNPTQAQPATINKSSKELKKRISKQKIEFFFFDTFSAFYKWVMFFFFSVCFLFIAFLWFSRKPFFLVVRNLKVHLLVWMCLRSFFVHRIFDVITKNPLHNGTIVPSHFIVSSHSCTCVYNNFVMVAFKLHEINTISTLFILIAIVHCIRHTMVVFCTDAIRWHSYPFYMLYVSIKMKYFSAESKSYRAEKKLKCNCTLERTQLYWGYVYSIFIYHLHIWCSFYCHSLRWARTIVQYMNFLFIGIFSISNANNKRF